MAADISLPLQLAIAGLSNCCAAMVTQPIDLLKTRLQIQGELAKAGGQASLTRTLTTITQQEGLRGFYRGLSASLLREASYSALRLGLYEPVKHAISPAFSSSQIASSSQPPRSASLFEKILAGGISGCIGAALANPADLLKVRLQAAMASSLRGQGTPSVSLLSSFSTIVQKEGGIPALWQGVGANVQRAALLTAAQVGSYDEIKATVKSVAGMEEGLSLHIACSLAASVICALVTSPVDLAKTRLMNQRQKLAMQSQQQHQQQMGHPQQAVQSAQAAASSAGKGLHTAATPAAFLSSAAQTGASLQPSAPLLQQSDLYKSTLDCMRKTVQAEGVLGLYKGFIPQLLRLGPHTIITFLVYEQLRKAVGMRAM